MKPATALILLGCGFLMVAASTLSSAVAVSVPERQVIPVSAATPAAVQVANDDAIDVVSDATTAEAQDAIEPEAVSFEHTNTAPAVNSGAIRVAEQSGDPPAGPASVSYTAQPRGLQDANRGNYWATAQVRPHQPAPPLAPVTVQAAAPRPAHKHTETHGNTRNPAEMHGRYVLANQPVYGRFGRVVGYRQVWVWQGASYQYQRPVYYRYSSCTNGRCN